MPSVANLTTPGALSVIAELVSVRQGVANRVAPEVRTSKDRVVHHLATGGLGFGLGPNVGRHAWGTDPLRITMSLSQVTDGTLERYTLEAATDEDEAGAASEEGLDIKQAKIALLTGWHAIIRERTAAAALFNTTTFAGKTTTLSGTDLWSDENNCNPIKDIQSAAELAASRAGKDIADVSVVVGGSPWIYLSRNPQLRDIVKRNAKEGVMSAATIAGIAGVKEIIPATMKYNTAAEAATESLSYVWGSYILAMIIDPNPAPLVNRGCAYTAVKKTGTGDEETAWDVRLYREGSHKEVMAVSQKFLLTVSSTYGQLVAVL